MNGVVWTRLDVVFVAIIKKICLIGVPGVGKTSLVRRFVHSIFSDRYLTTVGVCIEKKQLTLAAGELSLVIWDLAGDDDMQRLHGSYLRGTAGYVLVADGTRLESLGQLADLQSRVAAAVGSAVPFVLALNKADLTEQWQVSEADQRELEVTRGWPCVRTSAKSGDGVEDVFASLATRLFGS